MLHQLPEEDEEFPCSQYEVMNYDFELLTAFMVVALSNNTN